MKLLFSNVGPLREWRPGMMDGDVVMFEPAVAYRSANGVVLTWWVGDSAEDVKLEVLDTAGQVVRTFEPAREGEERDRWSGPALPVGIGLQRVRWDLRTDRMTTFPGVILWGVHTARPEARNVVEQSAELRRVGRRASCRVG